MLQRSDDGILAYGFANGNMMRARLSAEEQVRLRTPALTMGTGECRVERTSWQAF